MTQFFFSRSILASVTVLSVCGCARHDPVYVDRSVGSLFLADLAKRIGSALPLDSDPLGLKIEAVTAADTVRLHCRLTNISHELLNLDRLKPSMRWLVVAGRARGDDGRTCSSAICWSWELSLSGAAADSYHPAG